MAYDIFSNNGCSTNCSSIPKSISNVAMKPSKEIGFKTFSKGVYESLAEEVAELFPESFQQLVQQEAVAYLLRDLEEMTEILKDNSSRMYGHFLNKPLEGYALCFIKPNRETVSVKTANALLESTPFRATAYKGRIWLHLKAISND